MENPGNQILSKHTILWMHYNCVTTALKLFVGDIRMPARATREPNYLVYRDVAKQSLVHK